MGRFKPRTTAGATASTSIATSQLPIGERSSDNIDEEGSGEREQAEASTTVAGLGDDASSSASGIKAISRSDVHRITSGQVILDLTSAVKELVENALDARSTSIEVRFKNFGLDGIEVIDNGHGIASHDYGNVALPHHTSKLARFDDLTTVTTFGFRGEALASLCAHADVTLLTATQDEAPMGTLVELGKDGSLVSCEKKLARQRGTTVSVNGLFQGLPVRRRELERNCKREYGKAQALLQAYALISKGVRWSSSNTTGPSSGSGGAGSSSSNGTQPRKNVALTISSASSPDYLMRNFAALFGSKAPAAVQELKLDLEIERGRPKRRLGQVAGSAKPRAPSKRTRKSSDDDGEALGGEEDDAASGREDEANSASEDDEDQQDDIDTSNRQAISVRGLISRPTRGSGRTSTDRQYLYINGRPWDNVKVTRAFNEVYRHFNMNQVPIVVADFLLPTESYDVNVSPDKRTIFLHEESQLVEALKAALEELWAPARSTLAVNMIGGTQQKLPMASAPAPATRTSSAIARDEGQEDEDEDEEMMEEAAGRDSVEDEGEQDEDITPQAPSRSDEIDESDEDTADPSTLSSTRRSTAAIPSRLNGNVSAAAAPFSARRSTSTSAAPSFPYLPPARSSTNPSSRPSASMPAALVARSKQPSQTLHQMLARYKAPQSEAPAVDEDGERDDATGEEHGEIEAEQRAEEEAQESPAGAALQPVEDLEYRESLPESQLEAGEQEASDMVEHPAPQADRGDGSEDGEDDAEQLRKSKHVSRDGAEADEDDDERRRNLAGLDEGDDEAGNGAAPSQSHRERPLCTAAAGTLAIDIASLAERLSSMRTTQRSSEANEQGNEDAEVDLSEAGIENANFADVESRLERVISKTDFAEMEILGQFNLGFIIARRRRSAKDSGVGVAGAGMDDLFIIDQHASDEKFNFETLQTQTKMRSQRLIVPRALELSATDELVATQHLDALSANGFEVSIDESLPAGSRVHLISQPVSKNVTFGARDLEELLYQLRDVTPGSVKAMSVRCSKARAMWASRACRKSVMIGTALSKRQMRGIVRHMGTIEQPWNCPHGRPTMRHLACLRSVGAEAGKGRREVMWGNAGAL
ncbi:DNA mismatch repair protein MutL [Jaminaea rosea]|uniref:DNA mismatch repair protein PMS1 n=1 Tax=Jaminaea rosea TaxID=1569628 RepID=A0A316UTW4_9BASI|nr:DNA mismatch repair protein MutL [Jaminaea rosea]PWN28737.1 DNA mismatch repair protein MutL [Jaminaea rosea]